MGGIANNNRVTDHLLATFEVFASNTNQTFLYNTDFQRFLNISAQKTKWSPVRIELTTPTSLVLEASAHPSLTICQSQIVRPLWVHAVLNLVMIQVPKNELEHETRFFLRIFYSTRVCVVECYESNSRWGNFIFCWIFWKPIDVNFVQKCQICVVDETLDWFPFFSLCYLYVFSVRGNE